MTKITREGSCVKRVFGPFDPLLPPTELNFEKLPKKRCTKITREHGEFSDIFGHGRKNHAVGLMQWYQKHITSIYTGSVRENNSTNLYPPRKKRTI